MRVLDRFVYVVYKIMRFAFCKYNHEYVIFSLINELKKTLTTIFHPSRGSQGSQGI